MKLVDGKVVIDIPIDPATAHYRFAVPVPQGMEGEEQVKAHLDNLVEFGDLMAGADEISSPTPDFAGWQFVED